MTLIQCYDPNRMENLTGCLRLQPKKLILLGDPQEMDNSIIQYREVLLHRGDVLLIEPCSIVDLNFRQLVQLLKDLTLREEDPVLDLTVSNVSVAMAAGALLSEKDFCSKLQVQRYDPDTNRYLNYTNSQSVAQDPDLRLTASQIITLYGGLVHPRPHQPPAHATPRTLQPLWRVVCANPKEWNNLMGILGSVETHAGFAMKIDLSVEFLTKSVSKFEENKESFFALLNTLKDEGVIRLHSTEPQLRYEYTHPLFRYCTRKAGNALEVKVLLEARSLKENGRPFFDDCQMGVTIDWDGRIFNPDDHIAETRNEIDLILTKGTKTLFISCKNGHVDEVELFKLNTVANEFGGPHVRKMLIAAALDRGGAKANLSFTQRAWDMDINPIPDAAVLSRAKWAELLTNAMK